MGIHHQGQTGWWLLAVERPGSLVSGQDSCCQSVPLLQAQYGRHFGWVISDAKILTKKIIVTWEEEPSGFLLSAWPSLS